MLHAPSACSRRCASVAVELELEINFRWQKVAHADLRVNLSVIPLDVEGVDKRYLNPRKNWPNQAQYDSQALALAKLFIENNVKFSPSQDILDAGPRIIHS